MSIKIEADRIKMYKIKGIRALEYEELPKEYLEGVPKVYMSQKYHKLMVIFNESRKQHVVSIKSDTMVSEYDFSRLWKQIELAGDRLHKINHKNDIEKTNKKDVIEWTGTDMFEA